MYDKFILTITILVSAFVVGSGQSSVPQVAVDKELFQILKTKDSLLFDAVFNICDSQTVKSLVCDDFEFYHDQSGITDSKAGFLKSIGGLCTLSYKPRRELEEVSLEVFPLYNQGTLYGAIQSGKHTFYAKDGDKPEYLTSTALFTHLWIVESGGWRLKRVLSYDHQASGR